MRNYLLQKSTWIAFLLAIVIVSVGYVFIKLPKSVNFVLSPADNTEIGVTAYNVVFTVTDSANGEVIYTGSDTVQAIECALEKFDIGCGIEKDHHFEFESDYHSAWCAVWQQLEGAEWDTTCKCYAYY